MLLQVPLGLQNLILLLQAPHLTDKGSKLVVEALDLLLLLAVHSLDVGVHLQLQRAQQSLVHLDISNATHTPSPIITPGQIHIGIQANLVATTHQEKG